MQDLAPGNCYDNAFVARSQRPWRNLQGLVVCHGYPRLQQPDKGHPAGTVYGHAWLEGVLEEAPDVVLCLNLVPDRVLPQDVYYAAGRIAAPLVQRFTPAEAAEAAAATGHAGPWVPVPPGAVFSD